MPRLLSIVVVILALACGREVVFVDPPPASSTDTTGTDTTGTDTTGTDTTVVQRVDLQVTVTIAPADTALARRLGLTNGRLANAQVTARRVAGQQGPQSGTTDSLGRLMLPQLIEGVWAITAGRALTETERGLLDSASADVTGFGGAGYFSLVAPAPSVAIEAFAANRGTLVISEAHIPVDNKLTGYSLGQYIEVTNNSPGTIFLDGKIFGMSLPWFSGTTSDCSDFKQWLEDPEGIWTKTIWAFPGDGDDHPLLPGASAILATDAIDHRVFHPDLQDLSFADFEFIGAENVDVDNPAVPNMREFPPWSNSGDATLGHGPHWIGRISIFLADAVDPDSLPHDYLPVGSPEHLRVPRDRILDVLTSGSTPETKIGLPYCPNFVHPSFDGHFAELVDGTSVVYSLARRGFPGGGLQRTKVSAADFERALPTPGRAP